jgi:hypothetical protein
MLFGDLARQPGAGRDGCVADRGRIVDNQQNLPVAPPIEAGLNRPICSDAPATQKRAPPTDS